MATYEMFRRGSLPEDTPPESQWHYFSVYSGKYEGVYDYAQGKGMSYYLVPADKVLENSNILICQEDKRFIFQSGGHGTLITTWETLQAATPTWKNTAFETVFQVWIDIMKHTTDETVQLVISRVNEYLISNGSAAAPPKPAKPAPPKYAWTLSTKGVVHAL